MDGGMAYPDYQMSENERRTRNGFRMGTVFELDPKHIPPTIIENPIGIPMARVEEADGTKTGWLHITQLRAGNDRHWWIPEAGEQVIFSHIAGGDSMGVIWGSVYSQAYPPMADTPKIARSDYKDGSYVIHYRESGDFEIYGTGNVIVNCEGNAVVKVNGNADIRVNGWAQIITKGRFLIKSLTQLILKGPSNTIIL